VAQKISSAKVGYSCGGLSCLLPHLRKILHLRHGRLAAALPRRWREMQNELGRNKNFHEYYLQLSPVSGQVLLPLGPISFFNLLQKPAFADSNFSRNSMSDILLQQRHPSVILPDWEVHVCASQCGRHSPCKLFGQTVDSLRYLVQNIWGRTSRMSGSLPHHSHIR